MPRYIDVDTIVYTDINRKSYSVKDAREISNQTLGFTIDVKKGNLLDEIASRKQIYGDNGESQAWKIFDINIAELAEVDFDIDQLKRLKIPI